MEEGPGKALNIPIGIEDDLDRIQRTIDEASASPSYHDYVKDGDNFQALRKHFLKEGKGRPPDYPKDLIVTNKLLLQLYVLKEEKHHSFDELTSWLHKLVPDTTTVTEGRIKHRISTLLKTCSTLSPEDCQALLAEAYNFHALPEPLAAIGLNRLHLEDACDFQGLPLLNLSNDVVISLENFRSQTRGPTTFVNRWLITLCPPCKNLTQKQLKARVDKVVKKAKDLSKRRDVVSLGAFHDSLFLDNPTPSPNELTCSDCDALSYSVKCKDFEIKKLQKKNEVANREIKDLKLKSDILEEEQKANLNTSAKLAALTSEKKTYAKENKKLKSESINLENEIESLKDKSKTYKHNVLLRKQNNDLDLKVDLLQREVVTLKEKTSLKNVSDLKRKVESEQAQKSKWKSKCQKLEDSLVVDVPREDYSDSESVINLRESRHNKFTSDVRLTYIALQGQADIPASKCSKVVDIVSKQLHGKTLKGLPCVSSVLQMADEGHHIAKQQIADKILSCKSLTLSSDGTSRQKQHYMERHVTLDDGTMLSLGFTEIAADDAKSMLEQAIDILEEISDIHCSSASPDDQQMSVTVSYGEKVNETLMEILKKIKSLMSDRAANMKSFDKLFHQWKEENLGPDDASTLFLFCNAHFLLGLSSATENVLKQLEEEISEPGTSFGGPLLFFKEQATLGLIRCAADVFGPRGDEKNGCRSEWLVYCQKEEITSKFCSFRSNRFNNIYENATAICFHRTHVINFLQKYCSHSNNKLKSIEDALHNKQILGTSLAVALFNKLLTGPYWTLMNSTQPYSAFPQYVLEMDVALHNWSLLTDLEDIINLLPVFIHFQPKIDFDLNFLLRSGDFCTNSFLKTFTSVVKEMRNVLKRQLSDFLEGGIFAGDMPEEMKNLLDKCPLTNLTGERLFGDFDFDLSKRRHCSTHHRSTINMWKHNQTAAWLHQKSEKEKKRILMSAQKFGKSLRKQHKEAVEREKLKIMKRIEENEHKKNEKEVLILKNRNKILGEILKKGFCNSEGDLKKLWSSGTLEDIKNQLRYRKIVLNEKNLKITGNKSQLYETLRLSILKQ